MVRFDEKHINPFIKKKVELYLRYLNNIFLNQKGTEEELKSLFNEINKKHPSIKFDQNHSKAEIEFLDVLVPKDKKQRLKTIPFKKKTDRQSDHQRHTQKVFRTAKYCLSKRFVRQTANSSAIVKNCKSNLQKDVMTHLLHTIENDKNIKKSNSNYERKCTPCKSRIRLLCCLQVKNHIFISQARKWTDIYNFQPRQPQKRFCYQSLRMHIKLMIFQLHDILV